MVGCQERQCGFPLPIDQGLADKNLARAGQIHAAVLHAPAVVDHDAVQRGALQGQHFGGFFLPMRIEQLLFEQMPAHLFDPLRLDGGNAPTKKPGGFHQLGRNDPAPRLLGQMRAWVRKKLDAARPQILALGTLGVQLAAHIAQEAGQHGQVQLLIGRRRGIDAPLVLRHHG